ncbi:MAG TPA: hypothetical protein VNK82_11060 [Terriglobales bacterium]|nr:hypothetical protein [Terriglobales bacterium]
MFLTIDNLDGAGPREYTASLDATVAPTIERRLNRPSALRLTLVAETPVFIVPLSGSRIILGRADGTKLFTGYLTQEPAHEYLGWGERGPVYRYVIVAQGDEFILDRKRLPSRAPFIDRTAGAVLTQLAEDALPGAFDTSAVQDVVTLHSFSASPSRPWSAHAAELARLARAVWRAHDGALTFQPVGAVTHAIDESSSSFTPEGLRLSAAAPILNDVTVVGRVEPRPLVKDYFLGDGLTLRFQLSHTPFTRRNAVILEEEYKSGALDPLLWNVTDPASAFSISAGKLNVEGGAGADGATRLEFVEPIELGGALLLQHGEATFTAPTDAVLGGLYSASVSIATCFAGFRVTPSAGQSQIQALVNGVATGPAITTAAGHGYSLTTRLYATQPFRTQSLFHSSTHPAGSGRGGASLAAGVRVVLEVHDVDPASPGSLAAPSTVLYDAVIGAAPAYVTYAPVNALSAHCKLSFTRVARAVGTEIRSVIPAQSFRTRLVGPVAEGAECIVLESNELLFHSQYVPVANEEIVVRYRGRGRAQARVTDPASIAALARGTDDGVRAAAVRVLDPPPRTAADCENAALAVLDDSTQPARAGEYEVWSDILPGLTATDVFPGDAVTVNVPAQSANFSAIVREVDVEAVDLVNERCRYRIAFANDAAAPLGLTLADSPLRDLPEDALTISNAGTTFIADLPDAEITAITSTTVTIDAGVAPPPGGGFEVRRSDFGWGPENDRNLVGRFTTQSFTVTRVTRVVDFFVRQFDNSSPPRYSRYSTALHVDYPL